MNECIPEVVKAMRAAIKETGSSKLFSASITADDPNEMIARGKYVLSQFGPLGENCAFLVDGYVAGGTAITVARRNFPSQFLHYPRAGHGAITSPQTQRGYTAFVHTKISRVIGASGIHTGTMSFGKMEGDASDKNIAFMLQDDEADGPYYHQEWEGMKQTTPIISGGMNALRLPAFFENLGHSNVILTAGGGSFGHKDGPKPGAISCRQGEESWKEWKAGKFGDVSLSDGIIEFAKTHQELKGAFLTFQKDADQIYPGWKEKLGYTGESSVQAATFDWAKKAAAAPYIGGWVYAKTPNVEGVYWNEVGYCPDGTAMNLAGNETNHPEKIKKDMHTAGSTLPKSFYMNAVGYLPDGTAMNTAGNNVNHPERIGPDLHKNGSPLPPPLKGYVNDIGYTPDGTPMDKAGNLSVKKCAAAAGGLMLLGSSSQAFVSAPAVAASGHNLLGAKRASAALAAQSQPAVDALVYYIGMGDVEYGKIYDIYFPPAYLRLFDGDFIKNDEPQGNQVFCQMNECIPEVVKAMRAAIKETGSSKLFSANITADDPNEMIARGKYVLSQFGALGENCAFLVDGYVAGGTAITVARRNFPSQFLHYHRAGHGAITSPQTQRGYTAFVHTKISRVIGASGIHTGTMSFGKMEGDASDKNIAFMLQDDEADGPYYHQEWEGMKQTTPIISGGMNALRLPAFFENLGHSNVILTAGGGSFGHKDGPQPGAISCRQGEESWKEWKAGKFGDVSLSDGIIELAKTHEELKGAFLTFHIPEGCGPDLPWLEGEARLHG
ncbi:unnamed protein product [Polarella glacialis]|uniref:Ribulose bisphosphate carboxylase large subunit C-terminal domain-containing protein n=1 Tax=Polarella glacialis TaxID=89957 RepID=A0A813KLS3_POLGL|nr:unnamed protein product [Polarella glacialis]